MSADAIDVVKLFAQTPGTVRDTYSPQPYYESTRFGVSGLPDAKATVVGVLADGSRVVISPFRSGTIGALVAMVYRARPGESLRAIGSFTAPTDHLEVAIRDGAIVESFAVYPSAGPCSHASREIRTFDVRGDRLHETSRRTEEPGFVTWLDAAVPPNTPASALTAAFFAERTPDLYRACFDESGQAMYSGGAIDLYGTPWKVWLIPVSRDRTLYLVPLPSGGSGGVFTAGVYRIDAGRVALLQTIRTNGHLQGRIRGALLDVASPVLVASEGNCCYSHVDVTTYRYDPSADKLRATLTRREATDDFEKTKTF